MKLFLKGTKCETMRCPIERRPYPPGMHGRGRVRDSEYLLQLREKQKARRIYGLLEKQFRAIYAQGEPQPGHHRREPDARCSSSGSTTSCSAPAFASSRNQARQFVRHGHVNGQRQAGDDPVVRAAQGRRRLARATRRRR